MVSIFMFLVLVASSSACSTLHILPPVCSQTEEVQQLLNKCYTAYAAKQEAFSTSSVLSFTDGSSAEDDLHR